MLNSPPRRQAFSIRPENGRSRALALSVLFHLCFGAVLASQLVPRQFIRLQGRDVQPIEVMLISEEPAGASGPAAAAAQPAVPNQAAVPEQPVEIKKITAPVKKPLPAQVKPRPQPASAPAAVPGEQQPVSGSNAAAESPSQPQTEEAQGTGGLAPAGTGSGSGSGFIDTSFGQADAPRFVTYTQPKYPLAARQQGRQGTVVLRLTIDEHGRLIQLEVLESPSEGFSEAAQEAVRRSTFAPAMRGGKPVAARAVLPVRFALR